MASLERLKEGVFGVAMNREGPVLKGLVLLDVGRYPICFVPFSCPARTGISMSGL